MVDNAEWWLGTTSIRYGIQHVNYTTLERHFKRSAIALCEFAYRVDYLRALLTWSVVDAAEFYASHKT